MTLSEEQRRKQEFVKALGLFLVNNDAIRTVNLDHLSYEVKNDREYVYIHVGDGGHSMKKVNVTADSKEAIMRDFLKALVNWQSIDYERSV